MRVPLFHWAASRNRSPVYSTEAALWTRVPSPLWTRASPNENASSSDRLQLLQFITYRSSKMITITAVTAETTEGLGHMDVYLMIRTSQGTFCSQAQPILEHRAKWDMSKEGMVVTPEENHSLNTL